MKNIQLHHADNLEIMKTLSDESIDVICIDPPYLYLKNQKLERVFDEHKFFSECKRLLTKKGFIVMFGRGESFYRWNTMLADLGFIFKEEIVWNKSHCTSPLMNLSRVHETIAIFTKKAGTINKVKIPYLEMKGHDLDSIIDDVKKVRMVLKHPKHLIAIQNYLENNITQSTERKQKTNISVQPSYLVNENRNVCAFKNFETGLNEKSIIRTDRVDQEAFTKFGVNADKRKKGNRTVDAMQGMHLGLNEKSIIKQVRDHYSAIHPTQKPVRLLERLLKLVIPVKNKKIVVADWFGGSFSTCEAVINLQLEFPDTEFEFIGTEIDEEYFNAGQNRIKIRNENIKISNDHTRVC